MSEEILNKKVVGEMIERKNHFCVIEKTANENNWHDVQTNSTWNSNPYGDAYAVVPDEMVQDILATYGYCDLEFNEDGTEVVAFTPLEIPFAPEPEPEPTTDDVLNVLLGVE